MTDNKTTHTPYFASVWNAARFLAQAVRNYDLADAVAGWAEGEGDPQYGIVIADSVLLREAAEDVLNAPADDETAALRARVAALEAERDALQKQLRAALDSVRVMERTLDVIALEMPATSPEPRLAGVNADYDAGYMRAAYLAGTRAASALAQTRD